MKSHCNLLHPVKSETLRLTFGTDNYRENKIDPFQLMKPIIEHFQKLSIGRFFWFIVDLKRWKNVCGGGEIEQMTPLSLHKPGEKQKPAIQPVL